MITSLLIKNFILIDELCLEFEKGLNAFTGETGAGKSIILKAIDIALGARTNKEVIKDESKSALTEVTFRQKNGDELVVSREITSNASKSRLNGALVNSDAVKELRENLIDIHSQHQTYTYIAPKYHIELLDTYIEKESPGYRTILGRCSELYSKIKETQEKLNRINEDIEAKVRQIEFLKFQIDEINNAEIYEGEEEELHKELDVLSNVQALKELCYGAFWALNGEDGSICEALSKAGYSISKASSMDNSLNEVNESFTQAEEEIKACASSLQNYCDRLNDDPQRLDEVNERLSLIEKLKRKYGNIFETYENLKNELGELEGDAQSAPELEQALKGYREETEIISSQITRERFEKGELLSRRIVGELEKLELAKTRFKIDIQKTSLSKNGMDAVEFLISTNVSQDLAPLAKVASGGEISRVMLAIKTVFARTDNINTIVFDEIDTGISGKTSQAVANSLYELSQDCQTIVVTHQPIIASKANAHFEVSKLQGDETHVIVTKLREQERLEAIARLASGDVNQNSLSFAEDLLKIAQ